MPIVLIMIAALLSGCTATYKQSLLSSPETKMVKSKSVLIATPLNGAYESKTYTSSGKMTALATRASFAKFTNSTSISANCTTLTCLQTSKTNNVDYYAVPEIIHWEDRATEWSGIPDRVEIKLSIYNGQDGKEISSTLITGKSKWMTFGGDHPQDLLEKPLNDYVQSLY